MRNKVVCLLCILSLLFHHSLISDKLGENAFVTKGFNNWKKASERFERHVNLGSTERLC